LVVCGQSSEAGRAPGCGWENMTWRLPEGLGNGQIPRGTRWWKRPENTLLQGVPLLFHCPECVSKSNEQTLGVFAHMGLCLHRWGSGCRSPHFGSAEHVTKPLRTGWEGACVPSFPLFPKGQLWRCCTSQSMRS
jgi:hypothetical protein